MLSCYYYTCLISISTFLDEQNSVIECISNVGASFYTEQKPKKMMQQDTNHYKPTERSGLKAMALKLKP
jgi:hypothetical protein